MLPTSPILPTSRPAIHPGAAPLSSKCTRLWERFSTSIHFNIEFLNTTAIKGYKKAYLTSQSLDYQSWASLVCQYIMFKLRKEVHVTGRGGCPSRPWLQVSFSATRSVISYPARNAIQPIEMVPKAYRGAIRTHPYGTSSYGIFISMDSFLPISPSLVLHLSLFVWGETLSHESILEVLLYLYKLTMAIHPPGS